MSVRTIVAGSVAVCIVCGCLTGFGCGDDGVSLGGDAGDVPSADEGSADIVEAVETDDGASEEDDAADDAGDGRLDDAADAPDTPFDPRSPFHEGVFVEEFADGLVDPAALSGGVVGFLGELPYWGALFEDLGREGPCVLQRRLPLPEPTISSSLDAGLLHVDGLLVSVPPIACAPMVPGSFDVYFWMTGTAIFDPGATISVRFDGGPDVGPGTGSVVATSPFVLLSPSLSTPPPLGSGVDLVLRWVPEASTTVGVAVLLNLSSDEQDWVTCILDEDTGSVTVPGWFADHVSASGVQQIEFSRWRSGRLLFADRESVVVSWNELQYSYLFGP